MDKMHAELTAAAENVEYLPALQVALSLGKNLLDKYYSLTDDSEVYQIAMGMYIIFIVDEFWLLLIYNYIYLVLHPKHKLKYLESRIGMRTGSKQRKTSFGRNLGETMKNTFLANWQKHLSHLKKRTVSI